MQSPYPSPRIYNVYFSHYPHIFYKVLVLIFQNSESYETPRNRNSENKFAQFSAFSGN